MPPKKNRSKKEKLSRPILKAIGKFRDQVNYRAEFMMCQTGITEGAHHRAIEAVWKELNQ